MGQYTYAWPEGDMCVPAEETAVSASVRPWPCAQVAPRESGPGPDSP